MLWLEREVYSMDIFQGYAARLLLSNGSTQSGYTKLDKITE